MQKEDQTLFCPDSSVKKESAPWLACLFPYGLGSILAMILSYFDNHSVLWAVLHGFCSWCYVFFHHLFR